MTEEPEQRPCNEVLCEKLHDAIDYMRSEWDMTYSEVVGCLEVVKFDILEEMADKSEDTP